MHSTYMSNRALRFANERQLLLLLLEMNVVQQGHFVLKFGKHADKYINKDAWFSHPEVARALCHPLALAVKNLDVKVVIAPAVGAVTLSFLMALELTALKGVEIPCTYADKDGEDFVIRRGFDKIIRGKQQVLVVEDILTTGSSAALVVEAVRGVGGYPIAVVALCNRGGVTPDVLGVERLEALINMQLETWREADCPLCAIGVPVDVEVGHRREFLARKH